MEDIIEKQFEVDVLRANHIFESVISEYNIKEMELNLKKNNYYFTETNENDLLLESEKESLKDKIGKTCDKFKDSINAHTDKQKTKLADKFIKRELSILDKKLMKSAKKEKDYKVFNPNQTKYYNAIMSYLNKIETKAKTTFSKNFENKKEYIDTAKAFLKEIDIIYKNLGLKKITDNYYEYFVVDENYISKRTKELEDNGSLSNKLKKKFDATIDKLRDIIYNDKFEKQSLSYTKHTITKLTYNFKHSYANFSIAESEYARYKTNMRNIQMANMAMMQQQMQVQQNAINQSMMMSTGMM